MKQLVAIERFCLIGHILSLIFGLAGLLMVLPNPKFIAALPTTGQALFGWSMAGGGVVYILLGAVTMALYAYQRLGWRNWLLFMLPAVGISLSSELLGTSTGFPFGHYAYLNGLGYKIAGLVPFTIPLSWFYVGLSTYLLAWVGLEATGIKGWIKQVSTIALGALLLTAWDFVLDPAMSQTAYPFWEFHDSGQFFGMPYRNLTGWLGTGVLFMSVASFFWRKATIALTRSQLMVPLIIYLVNFAFGAVIVLYQLEVRFWIPTAIGVVLGVIPAVTLWWLAEFRTVPHTAREPVSTGLAVAAEREFF
ncbi:gamma-carotene 1'-hydroxylase CruF [Leptolyngbya sp. FACHB-16]|uniref:gamma-carotene 1'-hydroxylase CruF n=1 Tax=unclassified Leptolyngbya TaxID=2650499 RepID=UPI0016884645|nr:carotenoid biosynthesis protein [Leptolyngbya sp. FACHB-16]MBD2154511.1 carotenoid biosynthesis protein [Leptolyngbya sp. FACHB-16]